MKELYSSSEIAEALEITERAFRKRANKQNLVSKKIQNKKGGGKQNLYAWIDLPANIRQKVTARAFECRPEMVPLNNFDEDKVKVLMGRFKNASKKSRNVAGARLLILQTLDDFIQSKKIKQAAGEERFICLYNGHAVLGLEPRIYGIVKQISTPTIRRWRSKFRKEGLAGLLTDYGKNRGRIRAITPEMRIFISGQVKGRPSLRPIHIYKLIKKSFDSCPDKSTIYRYIKRWKKENPQLSAILSNPAKWKNSYQPAFGSMSAGIKHFCHTLEADSTPADIITADGKRCAIVGFIDVFSRRAVVVIAPTSKSLIIAACLRKAIITWGVPDRIRKDNGADYKSRHIEAITTALEIATPKLPEYSPECKPFIERFFYTFSRGLEELLPGYCGHSVADRQALREQATWAAKIMKPGAVVDAPLTLAEFQAVIDKWVNSYERSPHRGLGGETPLDVATKSILQPQKIRDERVLDILLAPVSRPRIINKKGIALEGAHFTAPELVEHIGEKVEVRRDLVNAGLVYVFTAAKGKFLCKASSEVLEGKSLENYKIAKKRHVGALKEKARALETLHLTNRTPIQILLEDELAHEEQKVIRFQPEANNPAIREARKAVASGNNISIKAVPNIPPKSSKTILNPLDSRWDTEEDLDRSFQEMEERCSKKIPRVG
jgi:putative transposase